MIKNNNFLTSLVENSCPVCNSTFIKSLKHKKYCSSDCSKEARKKLINKSARERYHAEKETYKKCKWCNKNTYVSDKYDHNCCSESTCIDKHQKWKRKVNNRKHYLKKKKVQGKTKKQKRLDAEVSRNYRKRNKDVLRIKYRWRKKEKAIWLEEYKKNIKCSKCGDNRYYVLDFHHIAINNKEFGIAEMIRQGFSVKRIEKEIDKCMALCANCHREWHYFKSNNKVVCFDIWLSEADSYTLTRN